MFVSSDTYILYLLRIGDWLVAMDKRLLLLFNMKISILICILPQYVKYFTIGMDSNEEIWHRDKLEVTLFGIWEEHLEQANVYHCWILILPRQEFCKKNFFLIV